MILGATREQEWAVRTMMGTAWKQQVLPPTKEGFVRVKQWGRHGASPWYWVAPDGTVTDGKPK